MLQLVALHVLYVALGFHASHLQGLWKSEGYDTLRSRQPGMAGDGMEHVSVDEALLAEPLLGLDRLCESAGEEDLGTGSDVAWEADGEADAPAGVIAHVSVS